MSEFQDLAIQLHSCTGAPGNVTSVWNSVDLHVDACSFNNDSACMEDEDIRFNTFANFPQGSQANHKSLAVNCLFYTGVNTRVQCAFCCGVANCVIIQNFVFTDRQVHYHDCPVLQGHEHLYMVKAFLDRPEVRLLLDYGFSRGRVRSLISRRLIAGEDCLTTSVLLSILEEES